MLEKMRVIKIDEDIVYLENLELSNCDACPAKALCKVDPNKNYLKLKKPKIELHIGDIVQIDTPKAVATRLSFLVYTLPAIIFIAAILIAKAYNLSDLSSFMVGISSIGVYYIFLRKVDKKLKEKYSPRIVKVIEENSSTKKFFKI